MCTLYRSGKNTSVLTIIFFSWYKVSWCIQVLLDMHSHGIYYFLCPQNADAKILNYVYPRDIVNMTPWTQLITYLTSSFGCLKDNTNLIVGGALDFSQYSIPIPHLSEQHYEQSVAQVKI